MAKGLIDGVQFRVDGIFVLGETVMAGETVYVEAGTVMAENRAGELFVYVNSPRRSDEELYDRRGWPAAFSCGITLYRDNWRHVGASKGSPVIKAIRAGRWTVLRGTADWIAKSVASIAA